jgi:hypothetical protein
MQKRKFPRNSTGWKFFLSRGVLFPAQNWANWAVHDLTAAFDRMNVGYFGGRLSRPRLTWSDTFTGRKFGHYDPVHDSVMVSATLDQAKVPALTVDFVVYHELLHRELGIAWHNGQTRPHDQRFQEAERQFEQFNRAKQVLDRLASEARAVR